MDIMDGIAMVQAELAATMDLLREAVAAQDVVGISQIEHRRRELDDELLAYMDTPQEDAT